MRSSRVLGAAIAVFGAGMVAAVVGVNRYDDAYAWVAHTSDVRLVIGRGVGHATSAASCDGLRRDLGDLQSLTADNPVQQGRLPAMRASISLVCAGQPAPELVGQLAELDDTERDLLADRRLRLAATRWWSILAFVSATLAAIAAVLVARTLHGRAIRALEDSEERFRLLASTSRDLIRIHDPSGRPTYVNPSVETLLGYTPDQFLAMAPLALGHPDDIDRMRATLQDLQSGTGRGATLVYRLRTKDGGYRWFETHTNPVHADGKLLRFYTSARDITERVELEKKLEATAVTDELTGLINRRGFLMMAGQQHRVAIRHKRGVAVIFADLDGLKTINDKLGHERGDHAIRQLATILRSTLRESDVVARLGGDEFAALAYDVDRGKVELVLARIRAAVAAAEGYGPYPFATSLGVALLEPGASRPLDELIAEADLRMYENKRSTRGVQHSAAGTDVQR